MLNLIDDFPQEMAAVQKQSGQHRPQQPRLSNHGQSSHQFFKYNQNLSLDKLTQARESNQSSTEQQLQQQHVVQK